MTSNILGRKRLAGVIASLFLPFAAHASEAELLQKVEALTAC